MTGPLKTLEQESIVQCGRAEDRGDTWKYHLALTSITVEYSSPSEGSHYTRYPCGPIIMDEFHLKK